MSGRVTDPPRPTAGANLFASPQKRNLVFGLLLVVATLALYNPVSRHAFLNYDDDRYVTENLHVRAGLHWETVQWAFTTFDQANWHPLTWLSHALDCQLFHLNPAGHHYTNVLLHACNVLLLFFLLRRSTGLTGPSLMVAALFALHPVNVESVAWVAERKNLLSMFFFLLALGAYGNYARKPSVARYLAIALCFALGLMAKPQVITFPFVLLLWDYWPLGRMFGASISGFQKLPVKPISWLILEKLPLMALSVVSAIVTVRAQTAGGAVGSVEEYPFSSRLENAAVAYARYVGKAFWPSKLSAMYPHPVNSLATWQILAAFLFLLAVTVLIIIFRRKRYLVVGWLWFLGTLVPMIGLVQVGSQAMADRYAYLPFVGLFIMICWGFADWAAGRHISQITLIVPSLAVLLALAVVSHRTIGYWNDDLTLWSHALDVTHRNVFAEDSMGGALVNAGRIEEAIGYFRNAVEINPRDPLGHFNIGAYEQQHGQLQNAIEQYQTVLVLTSDSGLRSRALGNAGSAYRHMGDAIQAKQNYEEALRLSPDQGMSLIGLGLLAQKSGDLPEAISQYSHAVSVQPSAEGYLLLVNALKQSGRGGEAQAAIEEAKRLSQNFEQAQQNADELLAQ
ncbi:MAG TPA: tetratricopeptide repeat protein [Terriglobales bacterium]|nr:tetratricopeptide repeat protein [Terriglobales bacterium]